MKRNLIIISILSVAAISIAVASKVWIYQNDNTRLGFDYDKLDSITYVTPGTIALSVSEKNVLFEGGAFDLDVVASQPWTVSISDPNSVKVSQFAGAGNATLKVTVAQNTNLRARTTTIKFTLQDGTPNTLNVITAPWQDKIEVSVRKKNIGFEGGSFTIDVKSNISWTVSTNKTWATLSKTKGTGNEQMKISVKSNKSVQSDTATVAFETTNGVKETLQIYRAGYPIYIGVCKKPTETTVSLNSNGYWSNVYLYAWDDYEQSLLGKFPGKELTKNNNLYSYTFADNSPVNILWSNGISKYDGGYQTDDILNISSSTCYELRSKTGSYETTKCKFCADNITTSDDGDTITISADGGDIHFYIVSEGEWNISSNKKWAEPTQSSGKGSAGPIDVRIAAKTLIEQDTASISFSSQYGTIKKYTIVRTAATPYVQLDKNTINIGCNGGQASLKINSNVSVSWTVSSDKDWVTFDKTKGTLNDSIIVNIAKSDKVESTSATITVTTSNGKILQCGVIREGDNVSVSPYSKTLPPTGGTYKIGVTSNKNWTVRASESWVTFDKTKGTLNDSILVIVAKSDKVESTSATITITTLNGKTATCTVIREGDKISVNPATKEFIRFEGGTINISVVSNTEWEASSSKSWTTLSVSSGSGNRTITVTVSENTSLKADTAKVTLTTVLGKTASTSIIRLGIEKCKASDYPQVTIGSQVWMAENYRCSKYDTESEAYNASWLRNNIIPTSEDYYTYTPYYTDASDKSKWKTSEYADNLKNEQVEKLGYLYNWAAAVGVEHGYHYGTQPFSGKRQGICPNGWHIPSNAEWETLVAYIEVTDGKGLYTAGNYLKTTSGWYQNGNGLDSYGFAALPASGSIVNYVGHNTFFWTATPNESSIYSAYTRHLDYSGDCLYIEFNSPKYNGLSVRCLRD